MPKNSLRVHEVGAGLRSLDIQMFSLSIYSKLVAHPFATGYRNTSDDDLLIAILEGDNRVNDNYEFIPPVKVGLITHLGAGEHLSHGGWNAIKLEPVAATINGDYMEFTVTSGVSYLMVALPDGRDIVAGLMNLTMSAQTPLPDTGFPALERLALLFAATLSGTAQIDFFGAVTTFPDPTRYAVYKIVPWKLSELAVII